MGVSRTLVGSLVVAGLLLAGAGTSAAWDTDSTIVADGATAQVDPLTAHGTQRGGNPFDVTGTGSATATPLFGGSTLVNGSGPITCLDIRGTTAGATVRITESPNPVLIGRDAYGTVVDGGPGGVDRANFIPLVGPALGCAPRPELATFPFTRGGVVIEDGRHRGGK